MIEYALLAGFVAATAAAIFPAISATGTYFSLVLNLLSAAISQTAAP